MAGLREFNSFVGKFINLWLSGLDADLRVSSKAGEATINLQVGLGHALHLQHHHVKEPGPSRLRRRERRAGVRIKAEKLLLKKLLPILLLLKKMRLKLMLKLLWILKKLMTFKLM